MYIRDRRTFRENVIPVSSSSTLPHTPRDWRCVCFYDPAPPKSQEERRRTTLTRCQLVRLRIRITVRAQPLAAREPTHHSSKKYSLPSEVASQISKRRAAASHARTYTTRSLA
jgi:hypothetical protein